MLKFPNISFKFLLSKKFFKDMIMRIAFWLIIYFLILPFFLNNLIYCPVKEKTKSYLNVQDLYLTTSDNIKINAWYTKAKKNYPTIVFCHGNGGNISYYQDIIKLMSDHGYGILLFDYRGYGKSEGFPTETGLYNDTNAALKFLREKEKLSNNQIVLWGLSLGGAVVTEKASKEQFRAVILQSTFTNIRDEVFLEK